MKKINIEIGFGVAALAALLVACSIWGAPWKWGRRPAEEEQTALTAPPGEVTFSEEKYAGMNLHCVNVEKRVVQQERSVFGKIDYRRIHRVELKAPVDSVVQQVVVKPGLAVHAGTHLALLTSPDVGLARAELEKSKAELEIADKALQWNEEITRNLDKLLAFLRDKPPPSSVEEEFEEKLLGDHRQEVMPAYSKYVLAERLWTTAQADRAASLPQRTLQERETSWRVAKEAFRAKCEQSSYDAEQNRKKAQQDRMYALQLVDVNQQKLQTLLGAYGRPADAAPESQPASSERLAPPQGIELTRFYLVAPFTGTVEQRMAADAQRVAEGTLLFVVANTDVLEVHANLREKDWLAVAPYLEDGHGHKLRIRVPAVDPNREFEATIDYVGRSVDPSTMAVPLIALLDNARHEFKPGMFAAITLPAGEPSEELVVPPVAIRTHDQQTFVFVETEPRTFRRVDVKVRSEAPEWVAIAGGLSLGQRVVADGSFLLKNEMLLPFVKEQEE